MKVIHALWIPETSKDFFRSGDFYIWVETDEQDKKAATSEHAYHLNKADLLSFMSKDIGIKNLATNRDDDHIYICQILLPIIKNKPIPFPSPLMDRKVDLEEPLKWKRWAITCLRINNILLFLKELHFLSLYFPKNIRLGKDLEFWVIYAQIVRNLIKKDHYIPSLKYQKNGKQNIIYPAWNIMSYDFEKAIQQYALAMPTVCVSGIDKTNKGSIQIYEKETILRQFTEKILTKLIQSTPFTNKILKTIEGTFIEKALHLQTKKIDACSMDILEEWNTWKENIKHADYIAPFYLCFKLNAAAKSNPDEWSIELMIESRKDPSFKIPLSQYWQSSKNKEEWLPYFGSEIEKNILILLGHASRIYPKLLSGLNTDQPNLVKLSLEEAFVFLKEDAWVLQDAGYKVVIPSWWTPKGQRRARIRLRAKILGSSSSKNNGSGFFSLNSILKFNYELSMDGNPISEAEFDELVKAKQSLVHFRGEWMELNNDQMTEMLAFFKAKANRDYEATYLDLLKTVSDDGGHFEHSFDNELESILNGLYSPDKFCTLDTPRLFQGELREYQKRGFSWLAYLEQLGLNPCLADDMGLGKTIQIIALLAHERIKEQVLPTLLIVPTSVLGNWKKEIERFAPKLKCIIHHGSSRANDPKEFTQIAKEHDVVITSFTLVRKDKKILKDHEWQRIVVDEAQNIKNPKAAQSKAILSLKSKNRIALTGTPVENRLLDLWSIMNFLNPSYLGDEKQFRRNYELPIQKENDREKSLILKRLIEPFILRREKTDKTIINDLPDKVEQKIFCNLTKEQATLYQAIVKEASDGLDNAESNQQQGIMLSTLMKLKQICNHPSQFLQDNSEFSTERSHKLDRLIDMVDEVLENNESLLIFSQFKEIGELLVQLFKDKLQVNPYFIHGGISSTKREKMIEDFQNPDTKPSIFILSLKAGGVGITLTKANHVFHFDRWWNPAVENQATDRAYRIGQKRKVMVHKFVTIGTLEERIDAMLEKKQKLSDKVLGSGESWLSDLDTESFKELIKLSKTAILE